MELTNQHYINIIKFIANDDNEGLEQYFNWLFGDLCPELPVDLLNKIDKFCILLALRITCVDPELELEFTCKKTSQKYNGAIDLYKILERATELHNARPRKYKITNKITVFLDMPQKLYYGDVKTPIDVVSDVIRSIEISGKMCNLYDINMSDKIELLESLPASVFSKIIKYAEKIQQNYDDIVVIKDQSPHDESAEVTEHKLGLYDNSMLELIKLCYNTNIGNYYMTMYTLCETMGFTADYVERITPGEANVFINQKRIEIEKQNQQQKQQQQANQGPTIGGPQTNGNF